MGKESRGGGSGKGVDTRSFGSKQGIRDPRPPIPYRSNIRKGGWKIQRPSHPCVFPGPGRCPCPAGCGRAAGARSRCSACGRRPGRRAGLPGKGGGGGGDGREDALCVAVGFFHFETYQDKSLRFGRRWPRCGGRGEEGISLRTRATNGSGGGSQAAGQRRCLLRPGELRRPRCPGRHRAEPSGWRWSCPGGL